MQFWSFTSAISEKEGSLRDAILLGHSFSTSFSFSGFIFGSTVFSDTLRSFKPPHLMENGMKVGKTQRANLTPATLLTFFSLGQVSYKTEQKQDRFENQTLHTSVSSWVNTSSLAQSFPPKDLIKYCVKHWYASVVWKGSSHGRKSCHSFYCPTSA